MDLTPLTDFERAFLNKFHDKGKSTQHLLMIARGPHAPIYMRLDPKLIWLADVSTMTFTTFVTIRFMCIDLDEMFDLIVVDSMNGLKQVFSSLQHRVAKHTAAMENMIGLGSNSIHPGFIDTHPATVMFNDTHPEIETLRSLYKFLIERTAFYVTHRCGLNDFWDTGHQSTSIPPSLPMHQAQFLHHEFIVKHQVKAKSWNAALPI